MTLAISRFVPSVWKCDNYLKTASLQAFAAKWIRTAVFWDVIQRVVGIPYGRFETTYRSIYKGHEFLIHEEWPIGCLDTMSRICHCTLRNIQAGRKSNSKIIVLLLRSCGNNNKCTILHSIYFFHYVIPTCFGIVAIFRKLTSKCHSNTQQ